MVSIRRYLGEKLQTREKEEESAVAPIEERQVVGYRILWDGRFAVAPRSPGRVKTANAADYATQPRDQPGANDPRIGLVSEGLGDPLPLCGV